MPDAPARNPGAPDKTYGSQPRVYDGSSVTYPLRPGSHGFPDSAFRRCLVFADSPRPWFFAPPDPPRLPPSRRAPGPRCPTDRRRLRPHRQYGGAGTLNVKATDIDLPPEKNRARPNEAEKERKNASKRRDELQRSRERARPTCPSSRVSRAVMPRFWVSVHVYGARKPRVRSRAEKIFSGFLPRGRSRRGARTSSENGGLRNPGVAISERLG